MRKALNENPRVQLAVLGIGGILLAIMLMTSLGGGKPAPEPDPAAATGSASTTAATPADASASSSDPAATSDPAAAAAAPAAPAPATAPTGTVPATPPTGSAGASAEGLLPSEGLPKDVLIAYARNKAIALLVIDPKGISDRRVERYTEVLRSRGDVEVFVVPAGKIADYARITQGVAVTQTPSLVLIRPRNRTDDVPTATVSEGFRSAKSVRTALQDALYTGGERPSFPK